MSESTLLSDIEAGRRLDARLFTLFEHCGRQGDRPLDLWDFEQLRPKAGWIYLGWCPAAATPVPRSNWGEDYPIAVLLENAKGERVWLHTPATPTLVAAAFRYYS
jgi:hypothetical protein